MCGRPHPFSKSEKKHRFEFLDPFPASMPNFRHRSWKFWEHTIQPLLAPQAQNIFFHWFFSFYSIFPFIWFYGQLDALVNVRFMLCTVWHADWPCLGRLDFYFGSNCTIWWYHYLYVFDTHLRLFGLGGWDPSPLLIWFGEKIWVSSRALSALRAGLGSLNNFWQIF